MSPLYATVLSVAITTAAGVCGASLAGCRPDPCEKNPGQAPSELKALGLVFDDATVCRTDRVRPSNKRVDASAMRLWIWQHHHQVLVRYVKHFHGRGWRRAPCPGSVPASRSDRINTCLRNPDGRRVILSVEGHKRPRFGVFFKKAGAWVSVLVYKPRGLERAVRSRHLFHRANRRRHRN